MDVADRHFAGKIELALLALMLGMEVARFVFLVVHPDDDSEEHGNDGHGLSIASSTTPIGQRLRMSRARW